MPTTRSPRLAKRRTASKPIKAAAPVINATPIPPPQTPLVSCPRNSSPNFWDKQATSRLLKKSSGLAGEARIVTIVEEDMAEKAALARRGSPTASRTLIALVDALPGELGDGYAIAAAVANVEPGTHGDEAHLAFLAVECDEGWLDQVDGIFVPEVHRDDPPATFECERRSGNLLSRHQPGSAISFGSRIRL